MVKKENVVYHRFLFYLQLFFKHLLPRALDSIDVKTIIDESCIIYNNSAKGIFIFPRAENLERLCSVTELFIDGTFKCCSKFFHQFYSIYVLWNVHYVPLVFTLLSDETEAVSFGLYQEENATDKSDRNSKSIERISGIRTIQNGGEGIN